MLQESDLSRCIGRKNSGGDFQEIPGLGSYEASTDITAITTNSRCNALDFLFIVVVFVDDLKMTRIAKLKLQVPTSTL